jgi:DNA-binding CsgD family transcriptional regulator
MAGSEVGTEMPSGREAAAAPGGREIADDLQRLVRTLRRDHAPASDCDEIVVEVEVDGARYTLLRQPIADAAPHAPLSSREREIARMVALGYTNKAMAAVLDISAWTVGTHLRRIYSKLGVHSRGAMVARLVEDVDIIERGLDADWRSLWGTGPRTAG